MEVILLKDKENPLNPTKTGVYKAITDSLADGSLHLSAVISDRTRDYDFVFPFAITQ